MKRLAILALCLAAVVVVGCGGGSKPKAAFMPTNCLAGPPFAQHPSAFAFSCDGGRVVKNVHWHSWGGDTATGDATFLAAGPCDPACSAAANYTYHVRLIATDIATCGSRRVYGLVTAYLPAVNVTQRSAESLRLESCQGLHG